MLFLIQKTIFLLETTVCNTDAFKDCAQEQRRVLPSICGAVSKRKMAQAGLCGHLRAWHCIGTGGDDNFTSLMAFHLRAFGVSPTTNTAHHPAQALQVQEVYYAFQTITCLLFLCWKYAEKRVIYVDENTRLFCPNIFFQID